MKEMKVCGHQTLRKFAIKAVISFCIMMGALTLPQLAGEVHAANTVEVRTPEALRAALESNVDIEIIMKEYINLDQDVNVSKNIKLNKGGYSLDLKEKSITIQSGASLNIYDVANTDTVAIGNGTIYVSGCLYMHAGYMENNVKISVSGGIFNMNDGVIRGEIVNSGTFNMKGGTLLGAACVLKNNNTFNMTGGSLNEECNLYLNNESSTDINGGTINITDSGTVTIGNIANLKAIVGSITSTVKSKFPSGYSTISLASGGGEGIMNQHYFYSTTGYKLPACKFTKSGYHFAGWKDASGTVHQAGATVPIAVSSNVTFTATWEADPPSSSSTPSPSSSASSETTSGGGYYSSSDDDDHTPVSRYQTSSGGGAASGAVLNSDGRAVFTFTTASGDDDSFDHFTGAQMNGINLEKGKEYEVTRGSTIITVHKTVLDSLDDSTHYLTAFFDDGMVTVPFKKADLQVQKTPQSKKAPKTGEV